MPTSFDLKVRISDQCKKQALHAYLMQNEMRYIVKTETGKKAPRFQSKRTPDGYHNRNGR